MRRLALGLLIIGIAACTEQTPVPDPRGDEPAVAPEAAVADPSEVAPEAPVPERSPPASDAEAAGRLLQELRDPETRADAEARLAELPARARVTLLRAGLWATDGTELEAARRLEHQWLSAPESARFVEVLLPHLFDEGDEIDFEELRSALGSSEIPGVLQEMREHQEIAGERMLLGALHRQLRAEHLPALVEMALSRNPLLAQQALDEVGIVACSTNRHRSDVARVFAGRVEPPDATGAIPEELVVALRAIAVDERLDDVRRPMFLWWALRWLRDVEPAGADDVAVLRDLVALGRDAQGLDEGQRQLLQIYAIVELTGLDSAVLDDLEVSGKDAEAALALARRARRTDEDGRVLRELAAQDPLAAALALELDPFMAPAAFVAGLRRREPGEALDWVGDVLHHRFRLRLRWGELPSLGIQPRLDDGLDPRLVLGVSMWVREVRGSHAVAAYLRDEVGDRALDGWEADVLARIEGPALADRLRDVLAGGSAFGRRQAGELLARLGDRASEDALLEGVRTGELPHHVAWRVAAWASAAGRARIEALLPQMTEREELETRAVLGGLSPRTADAWVLGDLFDSGRRQELRSPAEAQAAAAALRAGDAVGALLGSLDASPGAEIEGLGHVADPRVRERLIAWTGRPEEGRAHWAIGELAIAGERPYLEHMREVVRAGRYRWVDDASGEALFVGGGGTLGFWVEEAESNCCRAVAVKRVFEDFLGIDVSDEMCFQPGEGVTLGEWLRWRLGETTWLTPAAGECRLGAPQEVRGLRRSELRDGYVPALR